MSTIQYIIVLRMYGMGFKRLACVQSAEHLQSTNQHNQNVDVVPLGTTTYTTDTGTHTYCPPGRILIPDT